MNANELRIGNFIFWNVPEKNGVVHEVVGIRNETPQTIPISLGDCIEDYQPIPLTEEWLLRFGFEKQIDRSGEYYEFKKNRVYLFPNSFEFEFNSHDDYRFNLWRAYEYVHTLQNLYFALTGQELTIKEAEK